MTDNPEGTPPNTFYSRAARFLRKRKYEILLLVFSLIVSLVLLETLSAVLYATYSHESFSKSKIQRALLADTAKDRRSRENIAENAPTFLRPQILHPYMGFIGDRTYDPDFNQYGFRGPEPIVTASDDTVVVAVFGGSVALHLFRVSEETLLAGLREIPALSNKQIHLVSVALGGFKQPQQLMALNYFLVLGGTFDIVINLDGFNEVALPYTDNVPKGVAPFFPRSWAFYATKGFDLESTMLMHNLAVLRQERDSWRRRFARAPLRNFNFTLVLWTFLDRRNAARQRSLQENLDAILSTKAYVHQAAGPSTRYETEPDLFIDLARQWRESSVQMANLCRANNIKYFHFLQPNQYLKGSKILTDEERDVAIAKGPYSYRDAVEKGYGLLIEEGRNLEAQGVDFTDLTMLFHDERRTVYNDQCCHFNKLGYDMIAAEIVTTISRSFKDAD